MRATSPAVIVAPVLAGLALMVALGACGGAEEVAPMATATSGGTPAVTAPPVVQPTAATIPENWQSYADPDLGFSLRYPPDLAVTDLTGPSPAGGLKQRVVEFRSAGDPPRILAVAVVENTMGLGLDEWVFKKTACLPETIVHGTVAGRTAVFCTSQPEEIPTLAVVFEHAGKMFFVTSIMPASEFDLVIASLRP